MNSVPTTSSKKVWLDLEPWELIALNPLRHWCFECKVMTDFEHDESRNRFFCKGCGHVLVVQQLIIEGRLSESKYRGIERA